MSADRYREGVVDTLEELREVLGDAITETDIWAEYMEEEASK